LIIGKKYIYLNKFNYISILSNINSNYKELILNNVYKLVHIGENLNKEKIYLFIDCSNFVFGIKYDLDISDYFVELRTFKLRKLL